MLFIFVAATAKGARDLRTAPFNWLKIADRVRLDNDDDDNDDEDDGDAHYHIGYIGFVA